ncbi:MAG: UDP-N-acetylmuramate dehydrogenase, partial [bacterium]|nr:UDP-N-acetylmuramate dehydrogenase [bacterium]
GLLARKTAEAGLAGLEWMISLPGTIGGAVRGNAGCFGGEIKDNLKLARVLVKTDGAWVLKEMTSEDLKMSYRHSLIKENQELIVVEVVFELGSSDVETLKAKLDENLAKRKTSQPTNVGSAGCIFKNYEVSDSELETLKEKLDIPEAMQSSHRIAAGWIVDQLDLKGKQIGGAKISDVHGNFLVNDASASADEIMQLISFVKTRARNELGIHLQEEIQYVQ